VALLVQPESAVTVNELVAEPASAVLVECCEADERLTARGTVARGVVVWKALATLGVINPITHSQTLGE
jgi:hypothetical protein